MNASAMKHRKITVISVKVVSRKKQINELSVEFTTKASKVKYISESVSMRVPSCVSVVAGQWESVVVVWDRLGFSDQRSSSVASPANCPLASLQLRAVGCAWGPEQRAAWVLGCAGKGLQWTGS